MSFHSRQALLFTRIHYIISINIVGSGEEVVLLIKIFNRKEEGNLWLLFIVLVRMVVLNAGMVLKMFLLPP